MRFAELLKSLRRQRRLGIKQLAPELGVNYSYLSKLENSKSLPSEELIDRIAAYFGCERDVLYASADRIPSDALAGFRANPRAALRYLRRLSRDAARKS